MRKILPVEGFSPRLYQQNIFANSIEKNSLVILPTGLGKTIIALMLSIYYFNKNNKKVLFLAPTKPLVEQQRKSFEGFFKDPEDFTFQTLTGTVSPKKRKELYRLSDFIFSTPQLIENDLINKIIDPKEFSFVIFDECHRASGNYAYTFIAEQFAKSSVKFLGLSASPGSSMEEIEGVIRSLLIDHIEVRRFDDPDVKEYVKGVEVEKITVSLPEEFSKIKEKLQRSYERRLSMLKEDGFFDKRGSSMITKRDLLDLQAELRKDIGGGTADEKTWRAISNSAALMKLLYGQELFESQDIATAYDYFHNFFRAGGDTSKAAKDLLLDIDFRDAYDMLSQMYKSKVIHPKMNRLKEIVGKELETTKDLKIIVFSQYRETANRIVLELSSLEGVTPALFIGQAKKGDLKLSQKEQKALLDDFRNGKFNVLVSTSVGEEGLDIPKVDTVIFYEPVPSAIRSIQRIGRTGRFKQGKAYVLQSEGTRDIVTGHIANAKERKMYKVLSELKEKLNGTDTKELKLDKFIKGEKKEEEDVNFDTEPELVVDSRENSDLIKILYRMPVKIKTQRLEVADIVISEHVAIERKSKSDFLASILDKRLFPQLMDLARNYRRPVLILEGEENIYTLRNLNPNVIRATLSSIAVDLRIPIIYTDSVQESANMVLQIAKRTVRTKKEISLASDKRAFSDDEEMEKFVSTIPKINVVSAKSILIHFRTIRDLVNATEKQLNECEGIGKVRAKFLKEFFEREYKS